MRNVVLHTRSPHSRRVLFNYDLSLTDANGTTTCVLKSRDELLTAMREEFGLRFPADTRFRAFESE